MRPLQFLAPAVLALACASPAAAQFAGQFANQAPGASAAPPPSASGVPAAITTPVPPVDVRSLSPAQQRRREALYGTGWQYRMAPISPGANAGVPINPGVDIKPADLSNLDQRIRRDEIIMTAMRDSELARENAVIASIEPALPYAWERREMPNLLRIINFPDFQREIDWFRERF